MSIYEQQVRPFSQLNGPGGSHQPDGHQLSYLTKGEAKRCGGFFWLSWMICHFCGFFCETTKKAVPLGIPSCIFFLEILVAGKRGENASQFFLNVDLCTHVLKACVFSPCSGKEQCKNTGIFQVCIFLPFHQKTYQKVDFLHIYIEDPGMFATLIVWVIL